jgi:hypothetical protein
MPLLQEMKVARRTTNTSASAFVAKVPVPPPPAGGLPLPVRAGGSSGVLTLITEATARTRGRTRPTSPPLPLPRPLRISHSLAPFRCGPCRSLSAMTSSDLARVPAPTPSWRPPTPAMPPLTARPRTAPRRVSGMVPPTALLTAPPTPETSPYASVQSWDTSALAQHFNNLTLQPPPPEYVFDSGATTHLVND